MAEDVDCTPQLLRVKKRPTPGEPDIKSRGPFKATALWNGIVQNLKEHVKLKRCRGRYKTYEYCFAGSKAADAVLNYLHNDKTNFGDKDVNRDKAVKLCQLMLDFHILEKRGKLKDDSELATFDDSNTKYYQFCREDDEDLSSKENEITFGIVNQACTEHEEFIKSEDKMRISKEADDVSHSADELSTSQCRSSGRHGPVVHELMELTGTWKRYSAECLRKITPVKLFNRRPSLQELNASSLNTSDISIDVDRLPPAVEEELVKETALSQLLTLVDLPVLENILSYDSLTPRPSPNRQGVAYSNLAFRRYESICSIFSDRSDEDTWWEAGLDCLENHPRGLEILDDSMNEETNATQKLRMYQAITDHYTALSAPLWSDKFMDLHLGLFNLLMQSRRDVALHALQLAMILLHHQEREELRRLLRFLKYAVDDDSVFLSSTNTNRNLIERTFASSIVKNKMMTPHQSGHLVMFMVDKAFEMWDTPIEVEDEVFTKMREIIRGRNRLPRIEKTYCTQVSEDVYRRQQTEQTAKSLVDLMNSILDHTKFSLKEKKQRLKQFQKHHPDLFEKHFADML